MQSNFQANLTPVDSEEQGNMKLNISTRNGRFLFHIQTHHGITTHEMKPSDARALYESLEDPVKNIRPSEGDSSAVI